LGERPEGRKLNWEDASRRSGKKNDEETQQPMSISALGAPNTGGLHLGELRMSYRKWNTPLLVALIAAAAQIMAAIIHRL
jgi:hypothetical protein